MSIGMISVRMAAFEPEECSIPQDIRMEGGRMPSTPSTRKEPKGRCRGRVVGGVASDDRRRSRTRNGSRTAIATRKVYRLRALADIESAARR